MSSKTNSYAGRGFSAAAASSANTTKSLIIPGLPGVQAFCKSLHATGGHATTTAYAFYARYGNKTTVKTATADAATTIVLNGDDATGYINGRQIVDGDYLLIATNAGSADDIVGKGHGMRLVLISGATETGASDQVSCTVSGLDGHTGIEGIVSAGAVAWVVPVAQMVAYTVGAASIDKQDVVVSEPGGALGFIIVPVDATAHDLSVAGTFE